MPAPRRFTEAQLRDATLALVDEHGLAHLTMRNLAAALGTGAMTIYNYVDGREGLEALLIDAVQSRVERPAGIPSDDWRADLRAIAEAQWRALRKHPDVIPLVLTRRSVDASTVAGAEDVLDALARGGRSGIRLLVAFRALTAFTMGFSQAELAGQLSIAREETVDTVVHRVRALPSDRYPRLREVAEAAAASTPEYEFRAALDIVIAGLDGQAPGSTAG
jgi:AcrR family transcriptional regulator